MGLLNVINKYTNKKKIYIYNNRLIKNPKVICILRARNEELILKDTLNHLSGLGDGIVCFDDASEDDTFNILRNHKRVIAIIRNFKWLSKPEDRIKCETSHRLDLLNLAKSFNPEWIFCTDADERYVGDIRRFIESDESSDVDIIRISLFDAYITEKDNTPFKKGSQLLNFRKYFGPERRDIIMLWKAKYDDIIFIGLDSREPTYSPDRKIIIKFYCQHYGKSLSIEHWEETCNYYLNHFPYIPYGQKWEKRKGKAIHKKSDFGRNLYRWGEELFSNAIIIHPGEQQ